MLFRFLSLSDKKPQADAQGFVNIPKALAADAAQIRAQAGAVNGADLLQHDDGVLPQSDMLSRQGYMGRQRILFHTAGDGRHNHGGAVSVPDIVLNNKDGADATLLAPDDRHQIRIENISSAYIHAKHLRHCM